MDTFWKCVVGRMYANYYTNKMFILIPHRLIYRSLIIIYCNQFRPKNFCYYVTRDLINTNMILPSAHNFLICFHGKYHYQERFISLLLYNQTNENAISVNKTF